MDLTARDDEESTDEASPPPPFAATRRSYGVGFAPTPDDVAAVQKYFIDRRDELVREVTEIEAMIGFVSQSTDLAVRVAKIENFLGIKA